MKFDLVSLDMAGTTFDEGSVVYQVLRESVSAATGQDVPEELVQRWTGTSKLAAIRGVLGELGSDVSADSVYVEFEKVLETRYRADPPKPFDGVTDLFGRLRSAGVRVALQTGYSRPIAEALLESAGWKVGETIDALVTSDEVAASRPAPYLIFRTMEATGVVDVSRVLVAGDTANDLGAGTNAGAGAVIGLLSGAHDRKELARHPHTAIVSRVTEIEDWFDL